MTEDDPELVILLLLNLLSSGIEGVYHSHIALRAKPVAPTAQLHPSIDNNFTVPQINSCASASLALWDTVSLAESKLVGPLTGCP